MKKSVFTILLCCALLLTTANAVTILAEEEIDQQSTSVKGNYVTLDDPETIYAVDITWGGLEFNYNSGMKRVWNSNTLQYELVPKEGVSPSWTPTEVGGNEVTVTNRSNTEILAVVTYVKSTEYGIDGTIQNGIMPLPSAVGASSAPSLTATLSLSTTNLPASFTEGATNVTVGSVTVTITQGTANSGSQGSGTTNNTPTQTTSTLSDTTVASASLSGSGTEASPYLISSGADLLYLSQHTDLASESSGKYYQLATNIDVTAEAWIPIKGFAGIFDGNGHTLSGGLHATNSYYGGMFATMDGTVKDLTVSAIVSATNTSYVYVGGIVGQLSATGTIDNCTFTGTIQKVDGNLKRQVNVGGIAGTSHGTISNCTNTGTVFGADAKATDADYVEASTGGIAGWIVKGSVYGCTHGGSVLEGDKTGLDSSARFYTGRIVGYADSENAAICSCNTATTDTGIPLIGNGTSTACTHS